MSAEIATVFAILLATVVLLVTEKWRVDVVALLVLASLVVTGLVTPEQAISGFSNPAVVTVWAVFILSAGLSRTGVANRIGKQVLRLAGTSEWRLLTVLMLTTGVLSAFMSSIGIVALLLPVVLDIARRTHRPPSRLLLPLVFSAMLGSMTTLISTPTNLIISDALRDAGLTPFGIFDFTPAGVVMLAGGTLFVVAIGRFLLPSRFPADALTGPRTDVAELYELEERLALLTVPPGNPLIGIPLAESRIGQALGLNILSLSRKGAVQVAPRPEAMLQEGDQLLVLGRLDRLQRLTQQPELDIVRDGVTPQQLLSPEIGFAEYLVDKDSPFIGQTVAQVKARQQFGLNVLAVQRNGQTRRTHLQSWALAPGDRLLVQGPRERLAAYSQQATLHMIDEAEAARYNLPERLLVVHVPAGASLVGQSLVENRLASTFGLTALGLVRGGETLLIPDPTMPLQAGDTLIVEGHPRDLAIVRGLATLQVDEDPHIDLTSLESETLELVEVVLSPHTRLAGKTLQQLNFREKYGLNVLAIWHNGRAYRSNLADRPLHFGDALLVFGPQARIRMLGRDPDFLVLQEAAQEPPRLEKAPIAALILLGVIATVIAGWLSIAIAALIGATLMVISGCLTMDEAYDRIEWTAVFLIAGMLPLGIAMAETGAAALLAQGVISAVGNLGPHAVLAGLFALTLLATQFMPNPVVAVLLAPIVLTTAADLAISPYPLMLGVAFAISTSFVVPVGHAANVLVMGPGSYRFGDYVKAGLPLALVLLVLTVVVVPLLWPF